ncbi:hypothetical protein EalM132_00172 [Exiguobacterium phage vB_EalM-132]|nr:hypothetical protein EalM132_00002 [Exiguobacterium phage vB_EalM-132]AYP68684.1 hypothetical protein EalM132_00172 [Exiguobacterium phage vB_EalM-132]
MAKGRGNNDKNAPKSGKYRLTVQQLEEIELETNYHKLEKLCKWEHVDDVNEMLIKNISAHKVADWMAMKGFKISTSKLYEYKEHLQKAVSQKLTVDRLLGIGLPRKRIDMRLLGVTSTSELIMNEMELLDAVIQRGFNGMYEDPTIRLADAMKAIELKNKLTGGNHAGITTFGLDQLRAVEQRKFEAMVEVVMRYLPEEHLPELERAIAEAERRYYEQEAPHLLEDYERVMQDELDALRLAGLEEDEVVTDF